MSETTGETETTEPGTTTETGETETTATDAELEGLDERAKALIERANSQAARFRREARSSTDELERFRREQETEREKELREAEERGFAKAAPLIASAELAVAAAGKLRDPAVAVKLLTDAQRDSLLAATDETERRKRAGELVGELLEAHPYMAVENGNGDRREGSLVTQGARSGQRPEAGPTSPDAWLRDEARRR